MSKNIIIVGAGEQGGVAANILCMDIQNKVAGFLDDAPNPGRKCLGTTKDAPRYIRKRYLFFVAVGNNRVRKEILDRLKRQGAVFINALHPTSLIEKDVILGQNIMAGASSYININSRVEDGAIINSGCLVEHDNHIGSFAHLAPGVITGGGVSIGEKTFVGLSSVVNDHLSIGSDTIVGSGAVVINDLPDRVVAAGCPAKIIKKRKDL